jgi:hypothetical protein
VNTERTTLTKTFHVFLLLATVSLAQTLDTAISSLTEKATSGDAYAQAVLGMHYRFGFNVDLDQTKALEYMRKSAVQENPIGLYNLAIMTEKGEGLEKNTDEAAVLYKQSLESGLLDLAKSGDALAQTAYGLILMNGYGGIAKDETTGLEWRTKAADAGNAFAQTFLAFTIKETNPTAALKYARLAATQGFPRAKELAEYLGFDATAAKARADEQKGNTLVVKGLWLGMPIEDACQTINYKIGKQLLSVTADEKSRLKTILLSETIMGVPTSKQVEVLADDTGKVTSFLLSKDVLNALFDSKDMPRDEFLQTFINAYSIPELKSDVRELKVEFMGATSTIGFQQVYSYRSPKGFEVTFFGEPRLEHEGGAMQARMLGMADYTDAGSMLLKKIATAKARESKFD